MFCNEKTQEIDVVGFKHNEYKDAGNENQLRALLTLS
jgi:hypothetical protein